MRITLLALAAAILVTPALATDKADVIATIKMYNDDFNKGDNASANALCAAQPIIIDDFAPHAWQGASACSDWANALAVYDQSLGITNEKVTLDKPWHVTVTGDRAYGVYTTHYTYKKKGKPVSEQGVWTFALQKLAGGWRIAGWAWAQH